MHIVALLQHYHTPDCATAARPYALVHALAQRHRVTLITTNAWRERRLTHDFPWTPPSVRLCEIDVSYRNAMSARKRLGAFLRYAIRALWQSLRTDPPDLLYASSTPLSVAVVAALVARLRGTPWIFEVQDLWPDFPIQMGAIPDPLRSPLYTLEHQLYRDAAHVITVSPDMEQHVRRFRPDASGITTVTYGTDFDLLDSVTPADLEALDRTYNLESRRVVLYAGSFGRANAVPTLIEAARRLQHREDVCFVFAGDGYYRKALERAACRLANVRILPPQPYPQTLTLFRRADLSLVSFIDRPVLATNAPSKFYDSLAAGTPVVVTNAGWTKKFVEKHQCGWYVPPERPDALADRIAHVFDVPPRLAEAGRRGTVAARQYFDRSVQLKTVLSIIED